MFTGRFLMSILTKSNKTWLSPKSQCRAHVPTHFYAIFVNVEQLTHTDWANLTKPKYTNTFITKINLHINNTAKLLSEKDNNAR